METYHDAYCKAYEKCRKARDAGKRFIEIRPWRDTYRLYAHTKYVGYDVAQMTTDSICDWATTITNRIATHGFCDLPLDDEEAQDEPIRAQDVIGYEYSPSPGGLNRPLADR